MGNTAWRRMRPSANQLFGRLLDQADILGHFAQHRHLAAVAAADHHQGELAAVVGISASSMAGIARSFPASSSRGSAAGSLLAARLAAEPALGLDHSLEAPVGATQKIAERAARQLETVRVAQRRGIFGEPGLVVIRRRTPASPPASSARGLRGQAESAMRSSNPRGSPSPRARSRRRDRSPHRARCACDPRCCAPVRPFRARRRASRRAPFQPDRSRAGRCRRRARWHRSPARTRRAPSRRRRRIRSHRATR